MTPVKLHLILSYLNYVQLCYYVSLYLSNTNLTMWWGINIELEFKTKLIEFDHSEVQLQLLFAFLVVQYSVVVVTLVAVLADFVVFLKVVEQFDLEFSI